MVEIRVSRLQLQTFAYRASSQYDQMRDEEHDKKKSTTRTISFRLTDAAWLRLELEIAETNVTAHGWSRLAVLERLNRDHGCLRASAFCLSNSRAVKYLITQGFQLLAEDNLTAEEWKKFRVPTNESLK